MHKLSSLKNEVLIRVLILLFLCLIAFLSLKTTFSYYSDIETSFDNTFTAAANFLSAPITPSPNPTPTTTPTATPTATPLPLAQTLVINEFLWNSSCGNSASLKAGNYWIELYNGSGVTVNIKNWRFKDAIGNTLEIANSNTNVLAGQYVVVSRSASVFSSCYELQDSPVTANLGGSGDFLPATTGGVITLEQPNGDSTFTIVDRVEYGPTQNAGVLNTTPDQSIARNPNAIDTALGNTFSTTDFIVTSAISPGVSN